MNEEKILEQLKHSAEQIDVLESLKPEYMVSQLPEKQIKSKKGLFQLGAVAAAVCVLIGGLMVLGKNGVSRATALAPCSFIRWRRLIYTVDFADK